MNHLVISELTRIERKNVKYLIKNLKLEKEKNANQVQNQKIIEESKKALLENKEKRVKCFEDNRKRKLKNHVFEKLMKEYEKEGYELELNIAIAEKEILQENFYFKRIHCFFLILNFKDGIEKMVVTVSNGEKRCLSLQDMYFLFLTFVLEEEVKTLEMNHRIMQLYMLLNSIKDYPLGKDHPFYLSEEDKVKIYSKILEAESEIKEVEKQDIQNSTIDFSSLIVNDFLDENIETVYRHIFERTPERKKCNKSCNSL